MNRAWLPLGFVLFAACAAPSAFQAAGPGWIDKQTGNLIAVKVRDMEEGRIQPEQIVLVENPWAALIVWNDEQRRFHLFDNEQRTCMTTESWSAFLAALRSMPEGTPIQRFYKCTVPWDWAMPELERARLEKVMKSRRLTWRQVGDGDLVTVCVHGAMKGGSVEFPPK